MAWSSSRWSIRRWRGLVVLAIRSSISRNVLVGSMSSVMLFLPTHDLTNLSTASRTSRKCHQISQRLDGLKYSSRRGFGHARRHEEPAQCIGYLCAYRCARNDHVDHRHRLVGVAAGTDM